METSSPAADQAAITRWAWSSLPPASGSSKSRHATTSILLSPDRSAISPSGIPPKSGTGTEDDCARAEGWPDETALDAVGVRWSRGELSWVTDASGDRSAAALAPRGPGVTENRPPLLPQGAAWTECTGPSTGGPWTVPGAAARTAPVQSLAAIRCQPRRRDQCWPRWRR